MFVKNIKSIPMVFFWIVLGFIIWIYAFKGFLSGKLALTEDALSYHDHIKFFVENLSKGVFPLWDPFWFNGAPNDFFLRRIGAFNPFYSIIIILEFFKLSFDQAYLCFLALYYWGGMIAFYLLAKRIFNNILIAYSGYLILLFSALGTRLFDSYMMLITVPAIWFFYFLVAFSQDHRRVFFFGLCLSFMTLISTYIPFYFLSFLAIFICFFILIYFKATKDIVKKYISFFQDHKWLVIVSCLVVLFTLEPLIIFSHNSSKGQIAMPVRNWDSKDSHALVVPKRALEWGIAEDLFFSWNASDLRIIKFAVVYVPIFVFIAFALGLFFRVSRLSIFLFITGFVIFCCIIPFGLPFYDLLYKHIFFLKYFRNLHFFLWFFLIPLFVLLCLEHARSFINFVPRDRSEIFKRSIYLLIVHLIGFMIVHSQGNALVSTYVALFLSSLFWFIYIFKPLNLNFLKYLILTAAIVIQPLEVYYYLSLRSKPIAQSSYGYGFSFNKLNLKEPTLPDPKDFISQGSLYYATSHYNALYENLNKYSLALNLYTKFILVDHLSLLDANVYDYQFLEKHFFENSNRAYIYRNALKGNDKFKSNDPDPQAQGKKILFEDEHFKIISFDANKLKLSIHLPYSKFLIYNDNYDPQWKAFLNGNPVKLYETNGSFKGIWLEAGENIVEFKYGAFWHHAAHFFLWVSGSVFLICIIFFFFKER